jgi:hypothetical protein
MQKQPKYATNGPQPTDKNWQQGICKKYLFASITKILQIIIKRVFRTSVAASKCQTHDN